MIDEVKELKPLNKELFSCISTEIKTERVVLTDKQIIHMATRHPEAFNDIILALNDTIADPDYIIKDEKHPNTGLVIKEISFLQQPKEHLFIVLRICTDYSNDKKVNSVISGWKISNKRLNSYLRNKAILYKKTTLC